MANLITGTDTPLAALQRQQPFWRYTQTLVETLGGTPAYWYLGNITPSAIAVGPQSWIDAYRVWYVPPGNPQVAYWQDVAIRAPITSPVDFYRQAATLTGGSAIDPGLYIYPLARSGTGEAFGGVATNTPVAPRGTTVATSYMLDLIVYFDTPSQFATLRAPLVNASYAQAPGAASTIIAGTVALTGASQVIFSIPTYGRRRTNINFTAVGGAAAFDIQGAMTSPVIQVRAIHSGTAASGVTEAYVLNSAQYDFLALTVDALATATDMQFAFESTDD